MRQQDRARGALYGLAIGDALGMPTQMLSREQITQRWGPMLTGFEPAPPGHPIADGMPAGAVTDDTEQAVLLARLLLNGPVEPRELADAFVAWERDMAARGSLDLLGPSTRRAVEAVLTGVPPEETGAAGDTNGAAMRAAPVGVATAADDLPALVDQVHRASRVTHNTSLALAGAAAFAVLSAIPDDPWQACLLAASLGGDCDTIAAMAGAIAGACHGLAAFPPHAVATIDAHGFALAALADSLCALRQS